MNVGIAGVGGRMGHALVRAIAEAGDLRLAAATSRPGGTAVGMDAAALAGLPPCGVTVADDAGEFVACAAVIDFTTPAASAALAPRLAAMGAAHVVGTTGFSPDEDGAIADAAQRIAIVKSGNMSRGVTLLAALVADAARALPDADVEVVEMHHRRKVDAPSGTALLLGEAAAAARGAPLGAVAVRGRDGQTGPRPYGAVGFASLRGGTVVGEHDVVLALDGERIVLSHRAEERAIFARGAVAAARWTDGRPAGLYTMRDVLGLRSS
ncbi:4-hydroxy-tetrahydrodipicolinate reductase [Acuticoccus sp.]|uniref:4-hydroxy-tetrahydrodipicolinate reductase n=1 Tax=Acuticoccus sp. TaxID=1904378 RepID=UPI003B522BE4